MTAHPLPPGRELDALVATEIMGWRLFEHSGETWATTRRAGVNNSAYKIESQDVGDHLMFAGRKYGFFPPGWSPSTDIAAAFEVVEKLHALGWYWSIAQQIAPEEPGILVVLANDDGMAEGFAATAPYAICLAALDAVSARPARG